MNLITLDMRGIVAALVLGIAIFISGGGYGLFMVICMLVFLILSAMVSHVKGSYKHRLVEYNTDRGVPNVLANGMAPLFMAIALFIAHALQLQNIVVLALIGFVCSVAAITTDKFESEIGILYGRPIMITTMRKVKKGTSGGITLEGSLAGVLGALLIGLLILGVYQSFMPAINILQLFAIISIITLSGFLGGVVDSVLGYFEENGIGNKFTSNFFCSLSGALVGMALFAIFIH